MLVRFAIVASLLCAGSVAHALPRQGVFFLPAMDRGALFSLAASPQAFGLSGFSGGEVDEADGEARGVPRNRLGRSIFGWVLSASLYGMCLTAGMPQLMEEGDPQLIVVTLGSASPFDSRLVIPAWAETLARGVGVVKVASPGTGFQLTLVPLGPENAAGVSVSGCFG